MSRSSEEVDALNQSIANIVDSWSQTLTVRARKAISHNDKVGLVGLVVGILVAAATEDDEGEQ